MVLLPELARIKDNRKDLVPGSEDYHFSTKIPDVKWQQEWVMKMDKDCLWKMVLFKQSDEDILCENLNMVESQNAQLRDQVEDMERELDFKERRITEMETELKLLRNERE